MTVRRKACLLLFMCPYENFDIDQYFSKILGYNTHMAKNLALKKDYVPPLYLVCVAGMPTCALAIFMTNADALRYIMEHGLRATAWVERI
jgi:hypothetical protein